MKKQLINTFLWMVTILIIISLVIGLTYILFSSTITFLIVLFLVGLFSICYHMAKDAPIYNKKINTFEKRINNVYRKN